MAIIYHNPKCRKSRAGLDYIRLHSKNPEIREYIRDGITPDEINNLLKMLGLKPAELVRTQEDYYKENLKDRQLTDQEWVIILSENPRLIRRPIVVSNGRAVIADPPRLADAIL